VPGLEQGPLPFPKQLQVAVFSFSFKLLMLDNFCQVCAQVQPNLAGRGFLQEGSQGEGPLGLVLFSQK
jgi:hypothetical protein